jgi:hypothetical protein
MQSTYAPVQGSERVALPGAIATGHSNPQATIEVPLKLRRKERLTRLGWTPSRLDGARQTKRYLRRIAGR